MCMCVRAGVGVCVSLYVCVCVHVRACVSAKAAVADHFQYTSVCHHKAYHYLHVKLPNRWGVHYNQNVYLSGVLSKCQGNNMQYSCSDHVKYCLHLEVFCEMLKAKRQQFW